MERPEFERLQVYVDEHLALFSQAPSISDIMGVYRDGYEELFAPPETDFAAFDDGDSGPTADAMGPEVEDGIFNFVVHLVKNYSLAMTPEQARERVAAWLEEIAKGLRQFANTEE